MCIDPSSVSKYWFSIESEPTTTENAARAEAEARSSSAVASNDAWDGQCADKAINAALSCGAAAIGGALASRSPNLLSLIGAALAGLKCAKDVGDADTACRK